MMHLRCLVLFLLLLPSGARRRIRIDDTYHDAQQQNNTLADGLEMSAGAREALIPGGLGQRIFRRAGPHAGAWREGSKQDGRRAEPPEAHRVAPIKMAGVQDEWFRSGPSRAKVVLQAASGPEEDQLPPKEEKATGASSSPKMPVGAGVIVTVIIKAERVDDFLKAMEEDVTKSRDKALDPGCIRFDLLRDREDPNKFYFYEAYKSDDDAAFHKTTAHYKAWADFKASGGVVSQEVAKVETTSIPGDWAFQTQESSGTPTGSAVFVTVDISKERVDDFLKAMEDDATKSRDKAADPGCLRFDLLKDRDNADRYYFYEVYENDDAAAFHKTTAHYKSWADFKAGGGVANQVVAKVATTSIPGTWALQP